MRKIDAWNWCLKTSRGSGIATIRAPAQLCGEAGALSSRSLRLAYEPLLDFFFSDNREAPQGVRYRTGCGNQEVLVICVAVRKDAFFPLSRVGKVVVPPCLSAKKGRHSHKTTENQDLVISPRAFPQGVSFASARFRGLHICELSEVRTLDKT